MRACASVHEFLFVCLFIAVVPAPLFCIVHKSSFLFVFCLFAFKLCLHLVLES